MQTQPLSKRVLLVCAYQRAKKHGHCQKILTRLLTTIWQRKAVWKTSFKQTLRNYQSGCRPHPWTVCLGLCKVLLVCTLNEALHCDARRIETDNKALQFLIAEIGLTSATLMKKFKDLEFPLQGGWRQANLSNEEVRSSQSRAGKNTWWARSTGPLGWLPTRHRQQYQQDKDPWAPTRG